MEIDQVSGFAKYTGFITKALGLSKKTADISEDSKDGDTSESCSSVDSIDALNRVVRVYKSFVLDLSSIGQTNDVKLSTTKFKIDVTDQCLTCGWLVCEVMRKYTDFIAEIERESNIKIK